jgi:hypothetical protein
MPWIHKKLPAFAFTAAGCAFWSYFNHLLTINCHAQEYIDSHLNPFSKEARHEKNAVFLCVGALRRIGPWR